MSSLLDPVGPLDRGVYWRRRLVLLGVLVLLVALTVRACAGGGDEPASANGGAPAPTSSASSEPSTEPSGSPSPSGSPTSESSAEATGAVQRCADDDVVVTATPAKDNYAVGDTVNITYVVAAKDGVRCTRDVGGAANEVRVVSSDGSTVIWSSDHCSPGGQRDVRTLGPDDSFSVVVAWDGDVTSTDCPDETLPAPAGVYQVLGRNGDVLGSAASLTLG